MKRKYKISTGKETIEREYNYIPARYIIAILITLPRRVRRRGLAHGPLDDARYNHYDPCLSDLQTNRT